MGTDFDVAIVGGGLAGLAAALDLSRKGKTVALIAPAPAERDRRTSAIMKQSVEYLAGLGVWQEVIGDAAPLSTLRLIDGTRRLLRAPATSFHAGEIGETAFAYNVPNAPLITALTRAVDSAEELIQFNAAAAGARETDERVELELADGARLSAALVVAADGRRSRMRKAARIGAQTWRYPQAALVTTFSHRLPHENTSTEFHTEHGPFTQVPLPGRRSSLVWVMEPKDADILMTLGLDNLSARVEERMQSLLGAVEVEEAPQRFSLSGLIAHRYGRGRIALVGEAAHVFPPIGAQGLNLALRDVMALSKAAEAIEEPRDVPRAVGSYDRARRIDVVSRTAAVDMLNRSLLSSFLPLHLLRSAGLVAISEITPLRSIFMREGMRPGDSLRALRRGLSDRFGQARERSRSTGG